MLIQDVVRYDELNDDFLNFYRAIGVDTVHLEIRSSVSTVDSALGERLRRGEDCTSDFELAREKIESCGLVLNNIFMSCWPEISLGTPEADDKIDAWCRMIESLGRAQIPCLGWNFKPMGNFRTTSDVGRGGARYSTFD